MAAVARQAEIYQSVVSYGIRVRDEASSQHNCIYLYLSIYHSLYLYRYLSMCLCTYHYLRTVSDLSIVSTFSIYISTASIPSNPVLPYPSPSIPSRPVLSRPISPVYGPIRLSIYLSIDVSTAICRFDVFLALYY